MVLGKCRLCEKEKDLQDSHFFGKAIYKRLREPSLPDPRPIMFTDDLGKQSGTQIKDYVFCFNCEQIFNQRGENFVHPLIATSQGFPLLNLFAGQKPLVAEEGFQLFDGNAIPKLDCNALLHFGAGLFFKAAAFEWHFESTTIRIDICDYAEALRKFVWDGTPLPPQIAISLGISSKAPKFLGFFPPVQMDEPDDTVYKFYVSGMIYTLRLGESIPDNFSSTAFSAKDRKLVFLLDDASDVGRDIFSKLVANAKLSPELEELLQRRLLEADGRGNAGS
jgi:hypothetical protein